MFIDGSQSRTVIAAADSADVGYIFAAPGRRDQMFYGVMTNSDLIAAARLYLAARP